MERVSSEMLDNAHITDDVLQKYTMAIMPIDDIKEMVIREIIYRCTTNDVQVDVYNAIAFDKYADTFGTMDIMERVDKVVEHTRVTQSDLVKVGCFGHGELLAANLIHGYCVRHEDLTHYTNADIVYMLSKLEISAVTESIFAVHEFPGDIVSSYIKSVRVWIAPLNGGLYVNINMICGKIIIVDADLYMGLFKNKETYFKYICEVINIALTDNILEYGMSYVEDVPQ